MSRHLKALALILQIAIASGAFLAASAQAAPEFTGFTQEELSPIHLPTSLDSEELISDYHATPESSGVSCEGVLTGRASTGTDATFTAVPHYAACTYPEIFAAGIKMNGCHYRYRVTAQITTDFFEGEADLLCPEGRQVEIRTTEQFSLSAECLMTIPAQEGLGPVYFANQTEEEPADHLVVIPEITNMVNTTTGEAGCGVADGEHSNGRHVGSAEIRGYSSAGTQIDFTATDEPEPTFTSVGVEPKLLGHTQTSLEATQAGATTFAPNEEFYGPIYCGEQEAAGEINTGTANELTLEMAYKECKYFFGPIEVLMNGCDYRFDLGEQLGEDRFEGDLDIVCPEGKQIQIKMKIPFVYNCTVSVPAQKDLGTVYYDLTTDPVRGTLISATLTSVQSTLTQTGIGCAPEAGEFSGGVLDFSLRVRGASTEKVPVLLGVLGEEGSEEFTGTEVVDPSKPEHVHTIFDAVQTSAHQILPATGAKTIQCSTASLAGTSASGTSSTLTAAPGYGACQATTSLTTHVRLNGCDYILRPGSRLSTDKYQGSLDVVCPGKEEIELEVTKSGGGLECLVTIPSQEGAGPVYYENQTGESPEDVAIDFQVTNLRNRTSGGAEKCGVANGEHTTGKYTGTSTLRGFDTAEEQIGMRVSGE